MNHNQEKQIVKELLENYETTMLTTHDIEGGLVSRPMTAQRPGENGSVWFFVSKDSDSVKEIQANAEVNISFTQGKSFLSISGEASIVNEVEKKKELWYPELKYWFDGKGPEDSEVTLIHVSTQTARYWTTIESSDTSGSSMQHGIVKY